MAIEHQKKATYRPFWVGFVNLSGKRFMARGLWQFQCHR
jgi:hypothetical protein